ncbi:MAG: flagellar hook protein FlgE [Candidatus Kapabacteria bacterium]|nr:flagellar hook protein FlgE [Candidatus Kapabacteria bacterium]
MALLRSLTAGTSSLKAHQQRLDVISNNIANVNTTGYKSSEASFAEQFSQSLALGVAPSNISAGGNGGINPVQIGLGVKLGAVRTDFTQGSIRTTNRSLDLALSGDGFFAMEQNGQDLYTRAGTFSLDRSGNLVDSNTGAFVQGYNFKVDTNGRPVKDSSGTNILERKLTHVNLNLQQSNPRQTEQVKLAGNLNASMQTGENAQTSITIYDNIGNSHVLQITFTKSSTANQFNLTGTLDGNAVSLPSGAGTVSFNADGSINTPLSFNITGTNLNAALGASSTAFDTTKNIGVQLAQAGNLFSGLTQYAGQNSVTAFEQDGYTAGNLSRLSVDKTGRVIGAYTNGQSEVLAQVAVAKFVNSGGLVKEGNNTYSVSPNSGLPNIGTATEIFPSTAMLGGSLEESNVDLTEQFTDLISTQRAFEAASRTITISDQFLQEINQLKR